MSYKETKTEELAKDLGKHREELRALRFGASGSKQRNVKQARELRKTIARILTEMSARAKRT